MDKNKWNFRCNYSPCVSPWPTLMKPAGTLTSELWCEQQGLQQGVEVAGPPLVLNAAEIAFPPSWRRLLYTFSKSSQARVRRKPCFLLFLKKTPKHCLFCNGFSFQYNKNDTYVCSRVSTCRYCCLSSCYLILVLPSSLLTVAGLTLK